MDIRLSELLCTRLCHDLTGPIGAVNNGAEFMKEDPSMQDQAVDLVASSAAEAVARLMFYRVCYGRVGSTGECDLSERKPLAQAFLAGSKIPLDWPDGSGQPYGIPHRVLRITFNLILIAALAMLRKGTVSVRIANENGWRVQVLASGGSIKWEPTQEDALQGKTPVEALEPKTAQLAFTHQSLVDVGGTMTTTATETSLELVAQLAHG